MSSALLSPAPDEVTELTYEFRLAALAPRPQDPRGDGARRADACRPGRKACTRSRDAHARRAVRTARLERSDRRERSGLPAARGEDRDPAASRNRRNLPYALTERGRASALDALLRSGYVGAAPVPLADYVEVVIAQTVHARQIDRDRVRDAFDGMFMPESTADQFGISINSGRPVFLYGPAGTGKTYITQRLARLFRDIVLIPRAIAIDETIVQVFDPLLHKADRRRPIARASCSSSVSTRGMRVRAPGSRHGRRAHHRAARRPLRSRHSRIRSAPAAQGEQRPVPDRRPRPPEGQPRRAAQSLDRADERTTRFPLARIGPPLRGAVRPRARVLVEPAPARPHGRGVPAPHRPQDLLRPVAVERLQRRSGTTSAPSEASCSNRAIVRLRDSRAARQARGPAAAVSSTRSDRYGARQSGLHRARRMS